MQKNRILPTVIVALVGAIVGSFLMLIYASTHLANVAGPNHTPPAVMAQPLNGVSDQDRIVSAVKRAKPSVVAILVDVGGRRYVPFDPFTQMATGQSGQWQNIQGQASGSGFVYDTKGDIVTNAHVVTPPSGGKITKLTVVFSNGDKMPARIVSESIGADVAIIKVDGYKKLPPPLTLGDSDKLQQGQWAIAIGEPYGLEDSVTVGVVSQFNRTETARTESGQELTFKGLLQTSAPINPGNSGGPLLDIDGNVIGINQLVNANAQGIGFAIPSNIVKREVVSLLQNPGIHQVPGQVFAGVMITQVTPGFKNQTGYTGKDGVGVYKVYSGAPADQAGIQPGDVILKVDGKAFNDYKALDNYIKSKKPGDKLKVELWSQGAKRLATITLGTMPTSLAQQQSQQQQEQQQGP